MNEDYVSVGDTVLWKGCFGMNAEQDAVVIGLAKTVSPREKYGQGVDRALWNDVYANLVVFTLSNGHWAYGEQIKQKI